jgi:hypothetical protein
VAVASFIFSSVESSIENELVSFLFPDLLIFTQHNVKKEILLMLFSCALT